MEKDLLTVGEEDQGGASVEVVVEQGYLDSGGRGPGWGFGGGGGGAGVSSSELSLPIKKAGMLADLSFIRSCSLVSRSIFLLSASLSVLLVAVGTFTWSVASTAATTGSS